MIKEDFPLVLPLAFTQTALQRSVEYRQLAIEGSPTGMLMVDAAGTLVRVNGQFEMLFGYPGAELLGQRIEILNPIRPRGRHGSLRPSEGALDLGSKEVEQQMTARVDAAGDAIVINGLDGVIRSWNPAAERLLGFCTEQIVGQPIARIIPEDRQEEGSMILEQVRRGDTVEHLETVRRRQDGSLCDVSLTISPLRDGTGTVVGASKFMRDITDRKQIEAQLKMTNERFAIASEAAGLGFWDFEIGSNTLCWDDKMFEIYRRSHLKGEQPYALWVEALHPEDRARSEHELAQAINGTREFQTEFRIVHPNGEIRHIKASARITRDASGRGVRMYGVNVDITASKLLEQSREQMLAYLEDSVQARTRELMATLKEREVLLQEVHHRVKNNLQVIVSLINLQLDELRDDAGRDALEECQKRVHAIALIHEQLYQSNDYAHVPFSEYAKSLANNIFDVAGISRHAVSLDLAIEDIALPVDKAIPCGLMLNELLTNALKHAFPDGRTGTVRIELTSDMQGSLILVVRDDGIGLPEDFEVGQSKTLGSQLVRILAKQMDGVLEFGSANGTVCRLTIPLGE